MPEGHVLHRAARLQGRRFRGKPVRTSSPQGRFADGPATLNGQTITIGYEYKNCYHYIESLKFDTQPRMFKFHQTKSISQTK